MRILIIDDEDQICNFLKTTLESEYYEVDIAKDGERGSFLARTNDYDLIILDYGLPKKDGRTVCREIRNDENLTPILMLSVQSAPQIKAELLYLGADDYLSKPFSLEELLARIHALLRRPKNFNQNIIKIGQLTIDTEKHLVTKDDKEIDLTMKEFILLEYLAKNSGVVLSRGKILEHVWDMNADPFSNTIEVHISNLRNKMKTLGLERMIKTIPGIGYKFEQKL